MTAARLTLFCLAGVLLSSMALPGSAGAEQPAVTISSCWENWLNRENLVEGYNPPRSAQDSPIFIAKAEEVIKTPPGAPSWVAARNTAFQLARLQAETAMANFLKSELSSSRGAESFKAGSEDLSQLVPEHELMSIAEKKQVLTDAELDSKIRMYRPDWDGSGKSRQEKEEAVTVVAENYREDVARRSAVLAVGTTVVQQCEGPADADGTSATGQLSVLVGVMWSARLAYIATGMFNPAMKLNPGNDRHSVKERLDRLAKDNPDWMTSTLGSRVWTDENGERVLVGFGASSATKLKTTDERAAQLMALDSMALFAGESLQASDALKNDFRYRGLASGEEQAFDSSAYQSLIESKSKQIRLSGTYQVASWRGIHPVSGNPIHIVAMAWRASSRDDAARINEYLSPSVEPSVEKSSSPAVETPVKEGAPSSTSDY